MPSCSLPPLGVCTAIPPAWNVLPSLILYVLGSLKRHLLQKAVPHLPSQQGPSPRYAQKFHLFSHGCLPLWALSQSCIGYAVPAEGASEMSDLHEMDLVLPGYLVVPSKHRRAIGPACMGSFTAAACQSPESRPWGGPSLPKANRPPGKFCFGSHPPPGGCQSSCQKPQALQSCPETGPRGLEDLGQLY